MQKNTFSINDPIHGLIQFRDDEAMFVKNILQTPEFQRLRHIKQLGMAFYIYPGATHNRFSHSIGVAYLSKRIIQKLQADYYPNSEIVKLKLLAIACGLLHDVGHGPYSHMFEKAEYEGTELKFNHEEMTLLIIERICANPIFNNNEQRECLTQVIEILNKKNTLPKDLSLMRGLISSQLDTDRMDYLLRDSHFCGVTYGNYDLKWLIHSIELYPEESHNYLCINKKAIGVAENYLIARRLMTNCVYKHRKIVALEFICSKFIEQVFKKINDFEKSIIYKNQPIIKYLSKLKKMQNLEKCLNEYVYICDYDFDILITMLVNDPSHEKNDYSVIAKKIYKREIPVTYEIDFSKYDEAKILINEWKGDHTDFCDWQLHLDKRSIVTFKDEEKEKIFINDNNSIKLLQHLSLPIFSFTNKNEINPLLIVDQMIRNAPSILKLIEKLNLKNCFTADILHP